MLVGAALGLSLLLGADNADPVLLLLTGVAVVAVIVSLLWTPLTATVLVLLGLAFVLRELDAHVSAPQTAVFAAGLLLLGELIAWADSLRGPARVAPGVVARRVGNVSAVVLVGGCTAALTVEAGRIDSPNNFVAGAAGAAAVAAVLGVVWALGRTR